MIRRYSIVLSTFLILMALSTHGVKAQKELKQPNLRWSLAGDNSSYAGIVMVNQVWTRYIMNNPDLSGNQPAPDFDIGLRRSRLIFYTYLMDKVFIYTQVGADGLTFRNGKNPAVALFNAETEYILAKEKLHLGFGLNTWNGVSRYNNSKLLDFLVVDNPAFAYPVGGTFDYVGRQLGIYAKGTISRLHYRVSLSKPFETGIDAPSVSKTTERINDRLAFKGYFTWQFFDKENHLMPYMTMNNLGRAKLFNLGAGFYFHPEAMLSDQNGKALTENIFLGAVDAFLDVPLRGKTSLTAYLGYYYYDFGPDYLRAIGKMNVSKPNVAASLPQGPGNSEWEIGTGSIVRGEAGYLFHPASIKPGIQPFGAFSWKKFEALAKPSMQFDIGFNLLQYGHHAKWTFQYSTRPVYLSSGEKSPISRGQFILQTQIFF